MEKLTFEMLKKRADAVIAEELLKTISGGTENACHDSQSEDNSTNEENFMPVPKGEWIIDLIFG